MTTIKHILDNHTSREAAAIFGDIIKANTQDFPDWDRIFDAARVSDIVNSNHPNSKKIDKFAPSQILRAMTAKGMAIWVSDIAKHAEQERANVDMDVRAPFVTICNALGMDHAGLDVPCWPFTYEPNDQQFDTDISEYVEFEATGEDAEVEQPAATKQVPPQPTTRWDETMIDIANMAVAKASKGSIADIRVIVQERDTLNNQIVALRNEVVAAQANSYNVEPSKDEDGSDMPTPVATSELASKVFGIRSALLDFNITTWSWTGTNKNVPVVDPHYKFDIEALSSLLFSWKENVRSWVGGPTGSGKSTLIEQACAVTGTELYRFNCDKESSRYNLIGKVDVTEGTSYFKEGVLPRAMKRPSVFLIDEADAALGDITMALQPVLEGKSLLIGEDGGRMVNPHPHFRITATANTYGSGDSTGMYAAGVKIQSRASMNRYGVFINLDYMAPSVEMKMVRNVIPALSDASAKPIGEFLKAYRQSYRNGAVQTPISPRNTITMAQIAAFYEPILGAHDAVSRAINTNVVLSADEADADVIKGIADKALA
tara:strand:- start:1998 stop:3629 length:1632 start_codon:yes stop_codon:yes gene_type:complete